MLERRRVRRGGRNPSTDSFVNDDTAAARWNGRSWNRLRESPGKIEDGLLAGVAWPMRDRCVAVGVNESDNAPLVIQF